jgi:hypothetical protein
MTATEMFALRDFSDSSRQDNQLPCLKLKKAAIACLGHLLGL